MFFILLTVETIYETHPLLLVSREIFHPTRLFHPSPFKESGVSGQAAQPVLIASLKLSMAVYGQNLDGRPSR